ncbi:probable U3 small nucleolar RNA-associated protein 11 [Rhagoletis pomonella]|uniref:probable U3 small nucleolar RNA-associated protein 11 n=1 Tax=Rhagoletis pomonella TaxID=28610 RepID=UPI00177C392F|nr:probable U3 small nucleolar RNA-associated protein 11 [Rhagoletis pomonella]
MSSWKKASKSNQKVHRERHQPDARKHLGLLEKKKDYKKRANNEQHKERILKALRKRALNKNPDEFYHHMINSKLENDEHHEKEKEPDEHSKVQKALMETQDMQYVTMKRTMEAKKIQRLQAQLHMIDFANTVENNHIFFDDGLDGEIVGKELDEVELAKRLETHPNLLQRKTNRPRIQDLEKMKLPELTPDEIRKANALKKQSYQELTKRIEREKELAVAQQKLQIKRVLKQKRLLKPKKVRKGTKDAPPVYRFKYERKK